MPRRPKPADSLSAGVIKFRASKKDRAKLDELCAATGRSASEVLRSLLHRGELRAVSPPRPIWDQKALVALGRIGTNINQIARELNTRDRQGVSKEEIAAIDRSLLQVVAVTLSGSDAARMLFSVRLTTFMAAMNVSRPKGPSEPADPQV